MTNIRTKVLSVAMAIGLFSAYQLGAKATQDNGDSRAQALTFQGEVALWTVSIRPDKTSDFEMVLSKVREALHKSEKAERKQQAAGWRVMKMDKPMPDGNIAYVHMVSPVVADADYTVLKAIYDEFPNDSQQMYTLYRGAFAQNFGVATGAVVIDMSTPPQ